MPIKINPKEAIATYIKWEFLRRNKNYIRDYKQFCKNLKKYQPKQIIPYVYQPSEYDKAQNKYFQDKYGITRPLNPSYSDFDSKKSVLKPKTDTEKRNIMLKIIEESNVSDFIQSPEAAICINPLEGTFELNNLKIIRMTKDKIKKLRVITIKVDLNRSQKDIMSSVKNIVEIYHSKRKEVLKEKIKEPTMRNRMAEYERYIKILNLREQGKTYREIAQEIFPSRFMELNQHSAKTNKYDYEPKSNKYDYETLYDVIRKSLQASNALINGGYRKIR